MVKIYVYKNAIIEITKPTEKHKKNIEQATEIFVRRLIKGDYQWEQQSEQKYH